MHQPVFFWWRLKVVCAVPGMIQCSWRRCTTRRPGTRGAIGREDGDPGYPRASPPLSMSHSPPQNCCGTLFLTSFAACPYEHPTFQLCSNLPLASTARLTLPGAGQGVCSLAEQGNSSPAERTVSFLGKSSKCIKTGVSNHVQTAGAGSPHRWGLLGSSLRWGWRLQYVRGRGWGKG